MTYKKLAEALIVLSNSKEATHHYRRLVMELHHKGPDLPGDNAEHWRCFGARLGEGDWEGARQWANKLTV